MKRRAAENKTSVHQSAAAGAAERRRKKLTRKANWFISAPKQRTREAPRRQPQQQGQEVKKRKPPVSVLFCPQTPNGMLAAQLKEQERFLSKVCGESIKVMFFARNFIQSFVIDTRQYCTFCVLTFDIVFRSCESHPIFQSRKNIRNQ